MDICWKKTNYGYELTEECSDLQLALLKFDEFGNEYYISCIDNVDTGREYLGTSNILVAKKLAVQRVIDKRDEEINDIKDQIEELERLIS